MDVLFIFSLHLFYVFDEETNLTKPLVSDIV